MNKGKVDVLLGLQWGDEGKGKVVDVLTPKYDVVARFQGGPNAGHTLEFEGQKYVLRSIPSGIFQGGKVNIIGNGVVLAPDLFMDEAKSLEESGHDLKSRLHISKKAHLIMPTHRVLDAAYEAVSAIATVGLTAGATGSLSVPAQFLIILYMYFGRVGVLTISLGFLMGDKAQERFRYAYTNLLIG